MTLPPQLLTMLRQYKHELRQLLASAAPVSSEQFPLSHSQKTFWFLYQLNPDSSAYVVSYTAWLQGPLLLPALRRAIGELSNRHPVLRTRLTLRDGVPWQQVEGLSSCALTVIDTTGWSEPELHARVQADSQRPFDLLKDAPARLLVYQRSPEESVLLLSMPHIYVDGWSLAILVRELAALYRGAASQQPVSLPPVLATYADFVNWQQQRVFSQAGEAQLQYWLEALAGPLPILELPTDRPRPRSRSEVGATVDLQLTAELSGQLKAVAQELGTTLYALLLTAFAVLLHRYSGQTDLILGSPFHGRSEPRFAHLVGSLINTLPLRIRPTADAPFCALLDEVSRTARAALAHADYPLQLLMERLQPDRDTSRMPLFQVLFTYENFQDVATVLSTLQAETAAASEPLFGVPTRPFPLHQQEGQFDLSLRTLEVGDRIIGSLVYNTSLFDQETALRMVGHFTQLLAGVAAAPRQRVGELPLLSAAERHELLVRWNDTRTDSAPSQTFQDLFAAQVSRTPDAPAVVCRGLSLSYHELDRRANLLAHLLRSLGVGPEVRVALLAERSLPLLVGLLAVLKSGGAFVPLDPDYPLDRLHFMLSDARPHVVLSQRSLLHRLPPLSAATVCLDDPVAPLHPHAHQSPAASSGLSDLAYLIYTSGSSGRPKGVAIEHRSLSNYLLWALKAYQPPPGGVVPVHTSAAFDLTLTSLLLPLLSGSQLLLLPQSDPVSALLDLLRSDLDLSLLKLTPAHLRLLSQAHVLAPLRARVGAFVIGGEALDWSLVEFCRAQSPQSRIFNEYGPTETVVGCSLYELLGPSRPGPVPIGRPIANTQLYVLDARRQPVPIGVTGHLYIGGLGLARGYWNQPELTRDKFVPSPFSQDPRARLYHSGDLARLRADGNLEFLGRADEQVKLRGYRVELGEIEAVLGSHPAVASCAVVARKEEPGDKRLVAYVVAQIGQAPDGADLRAHLAAKLPEYMLPAQFVFLDALPQSVHGKLDRQALPAPPDARESRAGSRPDRGALKGPRNPVEQILADIFAQLLRLPRVGIHENFFALGGHSLLATQAISRILSILGVELPLAALFAAPTVAGLATAVAALGGSTTVEEEAPIVRVPRDAPLPLSFAQQRLWFLDQLEPDRPLYNMLTAIRLRGPLDVESLDQAIGEIVRRHEVLRTTFTSGEPDPLQHVHAPETGRLLVPRRLTAESADAAEKELRRLIDEEVRRPFSLSHGPLFRPQLLKVADDDHVLTLTMHHIISDGWSRSIFLHELGVFYAARRAGRTASLPELRLQVADICAWQRRDPHGPRMQGSLTYWKEQLAGCRPLELPLDHPRPPVPSHRGRLLEFAIDAQVGSALKSLGQEQGATLFMTLLAAFQLLLSRYSGQQDIAVGSPIANRTRTEMEPLIGCFINTLVLRTQLADSATFPQLLGRVRKVCLEAYAHQQIPFEQLVDELQVARDLSRNPLFQVMFVLQNTPPEELELPDLQSTMLTVHPGLAKFDLTLALQENADGSLAAAFEYATDLFEEPTIARLAGHYQRLLAAILESPALPETGNGKLDRAPRPEPAPERRTESFAPPQTPEEQLLAEIFAQLLGIERVGRHDNFFALGGHSLLAVRLFAQVAQRTGRTLPLSTLFRRPTLAELAAELAAEPSAVPSAALSAALSAVPSAVPGERAHAPERPPEHPLVLPLQREGRRPPLFCVHPVGGHVLCYADLARALGPEQPLYGVQAPPVPAQAPEPAETLAERAARYVTAIRKVQPRGPYQLLGWSLGGVLAFEMAGQLHCSGQAVALLALVDSHAPGQASWEAHAGVSEASLLGWFLNDLLRQHGSPQTALADTELGELRSALAGLRSKGLLPLDTDEAQLRDLYAMFRRNLGLLRDYAPAPYPGPVLLLRAARSAVGAPADHGWAALCAGALEIHEVPGDHYTILSRDTVEVVARILSSRLVLTASHLIRSAP